MTVNDDEVHEILNQVGDEIIETLATVAHAAQKEIYSSTMSSAGALANPSNSMVGQAKAERNVTSISVAIRDDLRRLLREPFVARVEVEWDRGGRELETYYFSRPSVAGLAGVLNRAKLVTSRAALGRLAEHETGDSVIVNGREGRIVKRSVFHPTYNEGLWDALVRKFETSPWGDVLEMLRHESLRLGLEAIKRGRAEPLGEEDILGQLELGGRYLGA